MDSNRVRRVHCRRDCAATRRPRTVSAAIRAAQKQTHRRKAPPRSWSRGRRRLQALGGGGLNRHVESQRSSGDDVNGEGRLQWLRDTGAQRKAAGRGTAQSPGGGAWQIRRTNQTDRTAEGVIRNDVQLNRVELRLQNGGLIEIAVGEATARRSHRSHAAI